MAMKQPGDDIGEKPYVAGPVMEAVTDEKGDVTLRRLSDTTGLKALGSQGTTYKLDGADKSLLEKFPNPMKSEERSNDEAIVEIIAPEFTSLCPLTGQPDFATIIVKYVPRDWCVESKSWKLYLNSFRNFGEFHESCVTRMFNDLWDLMDPKELHVQGQFTPRGGISFWPQKTRVAE